MILNAIIFRERSSHFQGLQANHCRAQVWAVRWYCKYGISYREETNQAILKWLEQQGATSSQKRFKVKHASGLAGGCKVTPKATNGSRSGNIWRLEDG